MTSGAAAIGMASSIGAVVAHPASKSETMKGASIRVEGRATMRYP